MDDVGNLLVLEDDFVLRSTFRDDIERFLEAVEAVVPRWDQLMLGGQHQNPPMPIAPGVVKVINCQRTHGFAIRGRFMKDLYQIWSSHRSGTHVDHEMGPLQGSYNVYAPEEFLFGQGKSPSDIGKGNPTTFWSPPKRDYPVVVLDCPKALVAALREYGVHTGFQRDPGTDVDVGLIATFDAENQHDRLRQWLSELSWEVASMDDTVLALWYPEVDVLSAVKRCRSGYPIVEVRANTLAEALPQLECVLPNIRKRQWLAKRYVIVAKVDRPVMTQLGLLGWHIGYWRDQVTGYDNGLREWAAAKSTEKLRGVVETLVREAEQTRGAVACLWHPEVTVEEAREVTDLEVVEVVAETCEEALEKWSSATGGAS
jgi:hypothetical protein